MSGVALGVDAGASSTRWLLTGPAGELARGRLGPLSGHLFDTAAVDSARARVAELAAALRDHPRPAAVVAGVTGLSDDDPVARRLAAALADALGVAPERVTVRHDMAVAWAAAFGDDAGRRPELGGVLVYGGTGGIAYAERGRAEANPGEALRAGGHGYLIDDAGGGFAIGRAALRDVLRRTDERGAPAEGALAERIYEALGSRDWPDIRAAVYGGGRERVAALAPAVARAAADGDPRADAILRAAGADLARLARVLYDRLGGVRPTVLAGGVRQLGPSLLAGVSDALPEGIEPEAPSREPVEGAALLARGMLDARRRPD